MAEATDAPALVDLVLEDPRWGEVGLEAVAERAARAALAETGRDPARHEVSLLACDDGRIAGLNEAFRGAAKPTNVLSWPAFEGAVPLPMAGERVFLGDMALAFETCAREARAAGIPLADHAAHLVVHGLLHLLGHDHIDDTEAEAMEAIETKTLASLGIADPYSSQERP
ncbi:MAG TPA: rRNA maturation RNase YbeY [Amaricoccus sp.]|uniref:rRNA maturation RNase YbeY n=1 Tax=Amaricoccus sp. TaxID=1872485 RepID=UPI002D093667|nr:rRNA maturation RNase YbeY [Amaricoccus sp.]HMQ93416.1 rRNA maturation RNase YbeY [Amaricoccus sp.]HMR52765.1 rRNA maturation RNase YbeY [Amaricoccus sp.]HMR61917.1 rRNA maturation RNase YbeY [Amaricoccus sp.]HMT99693.1 rRNA maturation RNase YbeY [Amaricoccus sp.]